KVHDQGSLAPRLTSLLYPKRMPNEPRKIPLARPHKTLKPRDTPSAQDPAARASLPIASPQLSNNSPPPQRRRPSQGKTPKGPPPKPIQLHSERDPAYTPTPAQTSTTLSKTAEYREFRPSGPLKWDRRGDLSSPD